MTLRELTLGIYVSKLLSARQYRQILQHVDWDLDDLQAQESLIKLYSKIDTQKLHNYLDYLDKNNVKFCCIWEEPYPTLLKSIADPPIVLFYWGNIRIIDDSFIGIVGTRNSTDESTYIVRNFVQELTQQNIGIASGMARGIDAAVHATTLELHCDRHVAVIPLLDNQHYNSSQRQLIADISANGCVLAQDIFGDLSFPGYYYARNRIIAGLSLMTLVIEAPEKSGALSTAKFAFGYDRVVYAVPGGIGQNNYIGSNKLIMNNVAKLVLTPNDILLDMGRVVVSNVKSSLQRMLVSIEDELQRLIVVSVSQGNCYLEDIYKNLLRFSPDDILSAIGILEISGQLVKINNKYQLKI